MKFLANTVKQNKAIVLILILALGLRLPHLNGSFWLDEAAQALESSRPLSQQLNIIPDFQPPLLHLITHLAIQFSKTEWWLRLWGALIPGLVAVWATYKIGERLFSKKTGIIASIFLSTSSFHIFFSQELRPYSLPTMWAMLSTLALIKIIKNKQKYKKTKILISPFTHLLIYSLAGLYSSYIYLFFLFAQLSYLLFFQKTKLKSLFTTIFFIFIFYIPWLPTFFKQLKAGQILRTQLPGWETVVSLTQLKAIPLTIGKFVFGVINLEISPVFITLTIIALALILKLGLTFLKTADTKQKKSEFLLLFIFTFTILSSWVVSFWIPVIRPKRLLFLLPLMHLMLSGFISIKKIKFPKLSLLLLGYILTINFYSTFQLFQNPSYQRENWRDLSAEINTRFSENNTLIVTSFTDVFSAWRWYDPGKKFDSLSTGHYFIENVPDLTTTLKPINNYKYLLVFDYLRDLTDPDDRLLEEIEAYGYKGIGVINYPNIGFVRIYTKESATISLVESI